MKKAALFIVLIIIIVFSHITPAVTAKSTKKTVAPADVPILMYHYIRDYNKPNDQVGNNLSVSPAKFDEQMNFLATKGYHTITPDNIISKNYPSKPIMLTFDDGYRSAYTDAYPILKKYNFTGVFYIITGPVGSPAYMTWDQIKEMKAGGMYFGSHTVNHPSLTKLSSSRISSELLNSKKTLEQQLGTRITAFCYPYGNLNQNIVNKVAAAGYTTAVTTAGGRVTNNTNRRRLPRIRIANSSNFAALFP